MNPQTLEVSVPASRASTVKENLPKTMRAVVAYAPGDYRRQPSVGELRERY
jgi:hypothetical protein